MKEFGPQQSSALASFVEPDRFSTGQSNRELHLHDISPHYGTLPAGIIWPMTTEEVAGILSWTYETGEHGVGIGKRKFMELEHGASYQLMRQIKELIDPKGLMKPGKIFM